MLVSFLGLSFGSSPFLCRCAKRSLNGHALHGGDSATCLSGLENEGCLFSFCPSPCQPDWHVLLAHRGRRVRQRTPNEAIKSTVDNNIRSFGWKLAPSHSPPATPQTFAVKMETEIPSAQP